MTEKQLLGWLAGYDGAAPLAVVTESLEASSGSDLYKDRLRKEYRAAYRTLRDCSLFEEEDVWEVTLTNRGRKAVHELELPVRKLLRALTRVSRGAADVSGAAPARLALQDLIAFGELGSDDIAADDLAYAQKRAWIEIGVDQSLVQTTDGATILNKPEFGDLLRLLQEVAQSSPATPSSLQVHTKPGPKRQLLSYLRKMGLVQAKHLPVHVRLTRAGRSALFGSLLAAEHLATEEAQATYIRELLQASSDSERLPAPQKVMTSEDLKKELFRQDGYVLAPIDVKAPVKPYKQVGRLAAITQHLNKVRKVFAQLGFEEARMTPVEFRFWNFDVLLFPPDHPDRQPEHAIYLANTDIEKDLRPELYSPVQEMWKQRQFGYLSPSQINRRLLRTHSTPAMIRQLQGVPGEQRRFAIGSAFTRERGQALSFHAEGIILSREISLLVLIDTLRELILRLGNGAGVDPLIKSTYYYYTMPSIAVLDHVSGERLAAGGMIRPEILTLLGYDVNRYLAGAFALFFQADRPA